MLIFAILAVFIAGLMVGRTPEYLGKKIEGREMKMAMLAVLSFCGTDLGARGGRRRAAGGQRRRAQPRAARPHRDPLRRHLRSPGNNGCAFAGLSAGGRFWTTAGGLGMLVGGSSSSCRCLAMAGSLARKKIARRRPRGTFPTTGPIFVVLLVGVILIVGALTFFPALALGPIVEHFLMTAGRLFSGA